MILRKGAVSAREGEKLLIPINMRDGSLICMGKGNDDWNQSAPHGAGRLMSRSVAKESFTVSEFKRQMDGIYTTSVNKDTLDECPMAYKGMDDIVNYIGDTVDVVQVIKPIYNFKAGGDKSNKRANRYHMHCKMLIECQNGDILFTKYYWKLSIAVSFVRRNERKIWITSRQKEWWKAISL